MTTAVRPRLLTADDLLRLHSEGVKGELIRGVLHETMPAGFRHGKVVANFIIACGGLIQAGRLGHIFGSDTGVLLEQDPDTVLEPDVAFVSAERLPLDVEIAGYCPVVPDLVVEVVSPSDTEASVDDKATIWLEYGARLVVIINPARRRIRLRQPGRPETALTAEDTLDFGDVLPGFRCPVSDIV